MKTIETLSDFRIIYEFCENNGLTFREMKCQDILSQSGYSIIKAKTMDQEREIKNFIQSTYISRTEFENNCLFL